MVADFWAFGAKCGANSTIADFIEQVITDINMPIYLRFCEMVGAAGLEPARLSAEDFKSPASANSATPPESVT